MTKEPNDVPSPFEEKPPPTTLRGRLRHVGPSLIITASLVGSGELIVTTTLGAQLGFVALWMIVFSCALKVVLQEEIGRYAVSSGETSLQAVNHVPGPRWVVSWVVWGWLIMTILVGLTVGGVTGGVAQALNLLFPQVGILPWGLLMCLVSFLLLLSGRYSVVERAAVVLVSGFTFTAVAATVLLQFSPHAISLSEFLEGWRFQLPPRDGLAIAFALFGLTGMGTTDLFFYPNWCIEKGYARFTGPNALTDSWVRRARGWIAVMQVDALAAMIIYTSVTIAFYLLGAGVLHRMGLLPQGTETVLTLSNIFTGTFGPWAFYVFLIGAFITLFSTLFVSIASNALISVDAARVFGLLRSDSAARRIRWMRGFLLFFTLLYGSLFALFSEDPVRIIVLGGMAQTAMLPVIAFSILYLRHRRLDRRLRPSRWIDVLLWISSVLTLLVAVYALAGRLGS